ncbi:MAG: nuclear transport factor 2 family protein [Novosphingobium sp.]|nr:nuclear transport factor 2 family protein [Novosphingobium sp.]
MTGQAEFQRISDELAIRTLFDEYCLRLEVNDFEEWLDLFTADSVYEVFRRELAGHDAIREMLSQAPHGVHIGGALRIELDGDRADTVQNYQFIGEDPATSNAGWYYRTVVRTDEGWKIARTRVKMQKVKG